ncbi:MAG: D-2-hydroxyacid dehydrogenase [Clostridia bacterium]|nr:D-2-hydroxyacid dehydrogenase [Clostridia bacterium]
MTSVEKVVLDGYTTSPEDGSYACYMSMGHTTVYDRTAPEEAAGRIGGAQVVLTNKVPIKREVMDACPQLRYVGVLATGYNVVDIEAAKARGIVVTNVPAYSTHAVVQHAMALLLHDMSRVAAYDERVKRGDWADSPDFCFFAESTEEIAGKTLGIVGYGHIGQAMARAALGMDMRVAVSTPHPPAKAPDGMRFCPLGELFAQSDVISLHCPLTEATRAMIGQEAIAQMKPGVRIINTARGQLVDARAVADALASGHIGRYMADVLEQEPPRADDPLLLAPNTVLTPHIAWAPKQTRERLVRVAVENVRAFLAGRPQNVVSR